MTSPDTGHQIPHDSCNYCDIHCPGGLAWVAIVRLVDAMRGGGSHLDFLDLTETMLGAASRTVIAGAFCPRSGNRG